MRPGERDPEEDLSKEAMEEATEENIDSSEAETPVEGASTSTTDSELYTEKQGKTAGDMARNAAESLKDKGKEKLKDEGKGLVKRALNKNASAAAKRLPKKGLIEGVKSGIKTKVTSIKTAIIGLGPYILTALIILWLLGIILAVVFMPAFLAQGIVQFVQGLWKGVKVRAEGAKGKVDEEAVYKLADYARSKGFQIYADGFIYEKMPESETPDGSTYIPEEGIAVDENDKITKLNWDNSPLKRYALMNAYTYTLEHEKGGAIGTLNDFFKMVSGAVTDLGDILSGRYGSKIEGADDFDGMIRIELAGEQFSTDQEGNNVSLGHIDYTTSSGAETNSLFQGIRTSLNMENKTLSVKSGWFSNPYVFDIDGWSGRYGMPTEFLLALHKSIMAPDLIYEITNGTKIEDNRYLKTKLILRLIESDGEIEGGFKVPTDTSINGVLYNANGDEVKAEDIDFEAVANGDVVYYARIGKRGEEEYFPLKTTEGKVSIKAPTNYDKVNGKPITTGVDDEYDITFMYIEFDYLNFENGKIISIANYIVNTETIKEYLSTNIFNWGAEEKAALFVTNFGLHNFVERFGDAVKEYGLLGGEVPNLKVFRDYIFKAVEAITNENYKAYLPLIYKVENHWFRDVYFFMNDGEKYALIDEDEFIKKGEYWTKYKEENGIREVDYQINEGEWKAYDIKTLNDNQMKKANFLPYEVDLDDEEVPKEIKAFQELGGNVIQIKENFRVRIKQTEDGRRGETNPRIKKMFAEEKWYIYDGTEQTADKINEARKKDNEAASDSPLLNKISKNTGLLSGSVTLENTESLDAEYAYRDYKELLLELEHYTVDDLSMRIRRVLQWPIPSASPGETWPAIEGTKDELEYGVKIFSKATVEELTEEALKDESGQDLQGDDLEKAKIDARRKYGTGFEAGAEVVSPVTGKIIDQGEDYIEILALNDQDNVEEYRGFFEDEYKGRLAGYTIRLQQIDVNIEDKSMYKAQISDKEIERLSTEEAKEKTRERENVKKEAPNIIGEYIKEGTVIGKTTEEDVVLIMYSLDKAIVEHIDKYLVVPYSNFRIELTDDYLSKIIEGEPNQLSSGDVDAFKKMFPEDLYPVLYENAEAFLEMQEMYDVNAIFAAAVSIAESGGGNVWRDENAGAAIPKEYNNIFSMTGNLGDTGEWYYDVGTSVPGSTNKLNWRKYKSVRESIMDFGKVISSGYHTEDRLYVSEIATKYVNGDDNITPESELWAKNTNAIITEALKRYDKAQSEPNSRNTESNQNEGGDSGENTGEDSYGENGVPSDRADIDRITKTPFDILRNITDGVTGANIYRISDKPFDPTEIGTLNGVAWENDFYYFNQQDPKWNDRPYFTINGVDYWARGYACVPCTTAMAFSGAGGEVLNVRDIMDMAVERNYVGPRGTTYQIVYDLANKYGVSVRNVGQNAQAAIDALDEGAVVVMDQLAGYWGVKSHAVLLVGKTDDGKFLINDPYSIERTKLEHDYYTAFSNVRTLIIVGPTKEMKKITKPNSRD